MTNHRKTTSTRQRPSELALDLLELKRLRENGTGRLIEVLIRNVALNLIGPGVRSELGGC